MRHFDFTKDIYNPNRTGFYCGWCKKPIKGSKLIHDSELHKDRNEKKK